MRLLNDSVVQAFGIPEREIELVAAREQKELERRERLYRGRRPAPDVRGRTVIVVDDGIATGTTMRVTISALRKQNPARLVVAVPVATFSTCEELSEEADEVICLLPVASFTAVGVWYEDFRQTSDEEVCELLERAGQELSTAAAKK